MARPTGDLTRTWSADEVSLLSSHIIDNPTRFGVTANFNGGPERYAVIANEDGTVAALQLVSAQRIRNVTPWTRLVRHHCDVRLDDGECRDRELIARHLSVGDR
jgi:hypothetical protein